MNKLEIGLMTGTSGSVRRCNSSDSDTEEGSVIRSSLISELRGSGS